MPMLRLCLLMSSHKYEYLRLYPGEYLRETCPLPKEAWPKEAWPGLIKGQKSKNSRPRRLKREGGLSENEDHFHPRIRFAEPDYIRRIRLYSPILFADSMFAAGILWQNITELRYSNI